MVICRSPKGPTHSQVWVRVLVVVASVSEYYQFPPHFYSRDFGGYSYLCTTIQRTQEM